MSAFILGFCCGIGWMVLTFLVWAVRSALCSGLDLGD